MCGIAGVVGRPLEEARSLTEVMNGLQRHRGPDHAVVATAGRSVLGNTRLAIQDPTPTGNQPFTSPSGRFVAVFNGEIYNWAELVEQFGLRVPSGCDGGVIPLLWERLGVGALAHFRGMYAVAVTDLERGETTLARDPFGIKPLHWRQLEGGGIAFASEARSLAAAAPLAPSAARIADFLHLGAVPATKSAFDGVESVAPNQLVVFGEEGPRRTGSVDGAHLRWEPRDVTVDELVARFTEAVDLHLRSDVPSTLLLSGGVDSTAIALAARRLGHRLTCLTVQNPGSADESAIAATTAAAYGHDHRVVPAAFDDGAIDGFFARMQSPTIDGLNTHLVCAAVHEAGFKVALTGLGGDEALGGYAHAPWLPRLARLDALDRLPGTRWRDLVAGISHRRSGRSSAKTSAMLARSGPRGAAALAELQRELFPPETVTRMTGIRVPRPDRHGGRTTLDLARAELELYMQPMLLTDADAYSMASSVELRVPFVDGPFFRSALDLAGSVRERPKAAFARGFDDGRLRAIASQPKRGFGLPMHLLLSRPPLSTLVDRLADPDAPLWAVVDEREGRTVLAGWPASDRWSEVWALTVLNTWLAVL